MLLTRVITAVVLLAALLASVFLLSERQMYLLLGAGALVGAWEWSRLCGLQETALRVGYIGGVAMALIVLAVFAGMLTTPDWARIKLLVGVSCLLWLPATLWIIWYPRGVWLWRARWARCLMGLWLLASTWLALSALRSVADGEWVLLYLVLLVSMVDIGGYFAGNWWGSVKMLPAVSPGKTWVGLAGGILAGAAFALLFWWLRDRSLLWTMLALSVAIGVLSVLGDLLESMVKRHEGVKDSGQWLAGHGGLLDRVDSLTAAGAPFALAWLTWFSS